jgi:phage gp29-like protein
VGKYHAGASQDDRDTLYRAVANIAGDCAAIIPEGMDIDFVEADNISAGADLYEKRADWLDRQVSKAVLGQTNTTDAQAGGLGSGQADAHNDVREDIEKADGKAAAAVLNRDLVRAWCDLEFGPDTAYPKVTIARPEQEDLKLLSESLKEMVPLGLRVSATEIRGKFGLSDPADQDEILTAPAAAPIAFDPARSGADRNALTLHARQSSKHPAEQIALQLASASNLSEFRSMLTSAFGDIDSGALADVIAGGLAAAHAAGRSDIADESA